MKILAFLLTSFLMLGLVSASYHDVDASVNADAQASSDSQASADSNTQASASSQTNTNANSNERVERITIGGVSADTNLDVTVDANQKLKVTLSNGRQAEIKIMPSTASATAIARLKLHVCSEENNCTIMLKETGRGNETKAYYEVKANKEMKVLGLFRSNARVTANIDAETGEVISVKRPWWAFVATDVDSSASARVNS